MPNVLTFLCLLWTFQTTPTEVVQKQLDTYNMRDIDGFMSVMSQDISVVEFGSQNASASGFEEVKRLYATLFQESPALHSTLLNRMAMGNKVIDHEHITGRMGNDEAIELIVVYEVNEQNKIYRITVLRP